MYVRIQEMYTAKSEGKKGLISRMWERCKSFSSSIGRKGSLDTIQHGLKMNNNSSPRHLKTMRTLDQENERGKRSKKVALKGCFSICVGPEKEEFVIKTEYLNHPHFKILLEEAELEYGYCNKGPLMIPCEVGRFINVLMEMDYFDEKIGKQTGCNFIAVFRCRRSTNFHLLAPPRVLALGG